MSISQFFEQTTEKKTYFIADLGANHDGDLARALDLIKMAADSGADGAKFQHFRADYIVSDKGFKEMGEQQSHQSTWNKTVYEVYKDASLPWTWTEKLADAAQRAGIEFLTSPYDLEAIDFVNPFVPAFKIGSGDITWLEAIQRMAAKGKPVLLATGASTILDVRQAVEVIREHSVPFAVMQCNTNYTGHSSNLGHLNLRVLKTFAREFPDGTLGLSDHSHGDVAVLGAVALGARLIEKHFTDDTSRTGPDHHFSMTPTAWRQMVDRTRDLEAALGEEVKSIAENEKETVVIQRRALRFTRQMTSGETISRKDLTALRPATPGGFPPSSIDEVVGRRTTRDVDFHEIVNEDLLSDGFHR